MLIAAAVILLVGSLLLTLLVRTKDLPPPEPLEPTAYLEERKATLYDNLRDLQFEYRVGKLSDADYQQTKLSLQQEMGGVMAEIGQLTGAPAPAAAPAPAPVAAPRNVCPHCGAKFEQALKFCGECGKPMTGASA
jgi:hypothetical protein